MEALMMVRADNNVMGKKETKVEQAILQVFFIQVRGVDHILHLFFYTLKRKIYVSVELS